MKTIITIIIMLLISPSSQARKSGGLRFWQGPGGAVIGIGALWGGYYLLTDDDEEVTDVKGFQQKNVKFTFYYQENLFQLDSNLLSPRQETTKASFVVKYKLGSMESFGLAEKIEQYSFVSFNNTLINLVDNELKLENQEFFGLGFGYKTNSSGIIRLELSSPVDFNRNQSTNLSLKYQYRF